MLLDKYKVGKIAERIVMNELEAHGYRATDLNKDGLAANSDILAARNGKIWQIQVKGATNKISERWWVQYGHCSQEQIDSNAPIFNKHETAYKAQYVAVVAVRSPSEYRVFLLPVRKAEQAAQLNLSRYYRQARRDGGVRKPGKVWVTVEAGERDRVQDTLLDKERALLRQGENCWELK